MRPPLPVDGRFAGPAAFGAISAGCDCFGCGFGGAGVRSALPVHIGFGAEQPRKQSRHAEIDANLLPVQPKSNSNYFHFGQLDSHWLARALAQDVPETRSCIRW